MKRTDEEPDYLAGTQPKDDPAAFAQVVREVFALEHGTTKDQHIARIVGRDSSRISQILKAPAKAESVSIKHLVSFLESPRNRERVVNAWTRAYFPEAFREGRAATVGKAADARTLKRVDRMIREGQLQSALRASREAAERTEDHVLREMFRDRVYLTSQRLDCPGSAMIVARLIATTARRLGETDREAGALLMRVRILLGLPDSETDELLPALEQADALVGAPVATEKPYLTGNRRSIDLYRRAVSVTLMERKRLPVDEPLVREILGSVNAAAKGTGSRASRFNDLYLAARCHLLLNQTFQAQELLERAFKSVDFARLNLFEAAGLLQSRVLELSGSAEERAEYLRGVSANCARSNDLYHRRIAEWDLARVEVRLFPAPRQY